ncbi:MAG TPA: DUF305 domain-containing protein [Gemmatimonadales bacterium]|nr:DUF305 domain-containing protein [Gemmatimonadales bacterium]
MALLLLQLVTGCAGAGAGQGSAPAQPEPATATRPPGRYPYTEADVRFMSAMIGHHEQALTMASMAPTHGASPAVQRLAERILAGQQDEIASMEQWLRDRGRPVPEGGHGSHGHHMPGMLTESQLRQLDEAEGPEFDRLFLTYMIQHHRGAVAMVKELFGTPGAAQDQTVFKFADDVGVDQTTEIARMERMLAELPSGEPAS